MGCSLADTLFNPLGVLKTRLQTSTAQYLAGQIATKPTLSAVAKDSVVSHGLFCGLVQPGLVAAWLRGLSYTAFRIGLYPAARDKLGDNVAGRIVAGAGTGAVASVVFNPIDCSHQDASPRTGLPQHISSILHDC